MYYKKKYYTVDHFERLVLTDIYIIKYFSQRGRLKSQHMQSKFIQMSTNIMFHALFLCVLVLNTCTHKEVPTKQDI
mgnify:CR=1 FL=1